MHRVDIMRVGLILIFVLGTAVAALASADGKGQGVYMNFCSSCHDAGIAGAPKTGDKAAWEARIAKGMDVLTKNAINGYQGDSGYMPPKGGNSSLTDDEVKAAVDYMVEESR